MPIDDDIGFERFIDSVKGAQHERFAAMPATRVQQPAEFDAMREHVLGL
jgi:hypothetical protein